MTAFSLDAAASRATVLTFAEGLFARLAHDLSLVASLARGTATRDEAGTVAAKLEIEVGAIAIEGVVTGGVVDRTAMSPAERRDCLAKMRAEVFRSGADAVVRVEVTLGALSPRARVRVIMPSGRAVEVDAPVHLEETVRECPAGPRRAVHARGDLELSLVALGAGVVKGPMNAFRVRDAVRLSFDVVFAED